MSETSQLSQIVPAVTDTTENYCDICDEMHELFLPLPKDQVMPVLAQFVASSGLVLAEDGEVTKRSLEWFAHRVGQHRKQLYRWMDAEPNWDAQVFAALKQVHGAKKVSRVLRGVFAEAAKGKDRQAELYLRHFWPDYKDPKAEVEHSVKGLGDLVKMAIEAKRGKVIDGNSPAALPGRDA